MSTVQEHAKLPCLLLSKNKVDEERFYFHEKLDKSKYETTIHELWRQAESNKRIQNPYLDQKKHILNSDEMVTALLNHTQPTFRCHGLTLGQMKKLSCDHDIQFQTTSLCCDDCYDEGHPRLQTHIFQCSRANNINSSEKSSGCCIC